jgi:hypothetical protein
VIYVKHSSQLLIDRSFFSGILYLILYINDFFLNFYRFFFFFLIVIVVNKLTKKILKI